VKLGVDRGLLLTKLEIHHNNKALKLERGLFDTGSATTLLSAEKLLEIGLTYDLEDSLSTMRGIGGSETVFGKTLQEIRVEVQAVVVFKVQVGSMDYGFALDCILGLDFLMRVGALIDLHNLEMRFVEV
jgi:gag-polyprotein putative aspartyl protease